MKPTVSVIIPTFNRALYILDSIKSVLLQSYQNFELIIVDDGSNDNTKEVVFPYLDKLKYIYQTNQGVSAARNLGIRNAKGKYIAFLDSDDLWSPRKLEIQLQIFNKYPELGLVYTNIAYINSEGKYLRTAFKSKMFRSGYLFKEVLLGKIMCGSLSTWLIKKDCFKTIGYLDTSLMMSEDRDISLRVAMKYKIFGIKEPLTLVRLHKPEDRLSQFSAEKREYFYFQILEKLFNKYNDNSIIKKYKKKLISDYYVKSGKNYLSKINSSKARSRFWLSILNYPFNMKSYIYLFFAILGKKLVRIIISSRKRIKKNH